MMIIHCTRKLLEEIGIASCDVIDAHRENSPLGSWTGNLLRIDRRKCVLFTSQETLFTFLAPGVKKGDLQNIAGFFWDNLKLNLIAQGYEPARIEKTIRASGEIRLGRARNKSVLGSMNDYALNYRCAIMRQGGLLDCDILAINKEINRMPMSAINYRCGSEALAERMGKA